MMHNSLNTKANPIVSACFNEYCSVLSAIKTKTHSNKVGPKLGLHTHMHI